MYMHINLIISNLDISPLLSRSEMVSMNWLWHWIISQSDIKHIMMAQVKQ